MYNTKKVKNCDRFKAINQSEDMQDQKNMGCKSCKFFNSRNCTVEAAGEIDPMPGMWS